MSLRLQGKQYLFIPEINPSFKLKPLREDFKKKKSKKSDIVTKGMVSWAPKPYF